MLVSPMAPVPVYLTLTLVPASQGCDATIGAGGSAAGLSLAGASPGWRGVQAGATVRGVCCQGSPCAPVQSGPHRGQLQPGAMLRKTRDAPGVASTT